MPRMHPDNHNEYVSLLVRRGIAKGKTTNEVERASEVNEDLVLNIKQINALANYRKPKAGVK